MKNVLRSVLVVLLLAFPALADSTAANNLAETIERFESLHVASGSASVSGMRLTSGHLSLTLDSGNAAIVLAGDEPVGLFFEGRGSLEYHSLDPTEFPVMAFNLKKGTSLPVERSEKKLSTRTSFERVLWLAGGRSLPEVSGSGGPSLGPAFGKLLEKVRRIRSYPPSHLFAQQKLDSPTVPLVGAWVEGGKEDLSYLYDEVQARAETLAALRKTDSSDPEFRRFLYPGVLSEQPLGRDRRDPLPPRYFLTDVDLSISASAGKDISLSVVETVVPIGVKQRIFRFDLYNKIYGSSGVGNVSVRNLHVKNVTDEKGKPLLFDHRDDEVIVETASAVEPDTAAKIKFEIAGDFLVRPGGDNYWWLDLGAWFPQPDMGGQFFTFHSIVRVKKPFVPFATGATVKRFSEGDENIVETRTDKPMQFATVLAGRYDILEETKGDVTIRVATYALKNERAMKQLTNLAFGIIDHYQTFLGPFPYSDFTIIEVNTWGFGVGPAGIMFITKEAFNPLMGELNQLFSQGINERFAHEIAHQYWGHVVKMPSSEEQWITESFAEYSAALFLKSFKGKSTYDSLLRHWKSRANFATEAATIPLANRVWGDRLNRGVIRQSLIYDKGAYLLAALHKELGDQTFLTFLKSYQKSFRWKFGSTKTVTGILQWLTKKDYAPFFEANYWGTAMPAI